MRLVAVESLRTIFLREAHGAVQVFANGAITALANLRKDFSYAVVDVAVAHTENLDRVFSTLSGNSSHALAKVLPRQLAPDVASIDLARFIRSLLQAIANLALVYDDSPLVEGKPAVYSANIMMFVAPSPTDPAFAPSIVDALKFVQSDFIQSDAALRSLRGVLLLRPDLSTSTRTEEPETDAGVPPLALPVPPEVKRLGSTMAQSGVLQNAESRRAGGERD